MFKFLENARTIGILKMQLTTYSPMNPYADNYYSYKITGDTIDILVHFPYNDTIHDKYIFSYNTKTNDFTMTPNDLDVRKGTMAYRKLQKALLFASDVIIQKSSFIAKVNQSRQECAKLIDPRHRRSSGSDSDSPSRSSGRSRSDGCNPSIRDAVYASSDDSGGSSSSRDRDRDND